VDHFGAFLNQTFHAFALFTIGIFTQGTEDFLKTRDMATGLFQMRFESGLELGRRGSLGHLGQCLDELIFRTI
jgi:hypothetical protein